MMPPLFAGLSPREKLFRSLFMFALLLVTILSLIPNPDDVPGGMDFTRWLASLLFGDATHSDKVAHFIAYGITWRRHYSWHGSTIGIVYSLCHRDYYLERRIGDFARYHLVTLN